MKTKISILIVFLIACLLSCEQEFEPVFRESEPELVVDAEISDGNPAALRLYWTNEINQPDVFIPVENARVSLVENGIQTEIMTEYTPGNYRSTEIKGKTGAIYNLQIETNDRLITASGTIPDKIKLDSLKIFPSDFSYDLLPGYQDFMGYRPYTLKVVYSDPPDETDYYRLVYRVNSRPGRPSYVFDDRLYDGWQKGQSLFIYQDSIQSGDTVFVDFQCIEKEVYKYFTSKGNFNGIPPAAVSPANPSTNLNGAVLGIFNCHSSEKRYKIVP